MEEMLVTSIFFFSYNVVYPSQDQLPFFCNISFCHVQVLSFWNRVNYFPNNKILDSSKAFDDNRFNVAIMMMAVFLRVEKCVANGKNAGYHHFLIFRRF